MVSALDLRIACITVLNEAGTELVCLMRSGTDALGYFQPGFGLPVLLPGAGGQASGPSPSQLKGAKATSQSLLGTGDFTNSKLDSITENQRSDDRFRPGDRASSLMWMMSMQVCCLVSGQSFAFRGPIGILACLPACQPNCMHLLDSGCLWVPIVGRIVLSGPSASKSLALV